MESIKSFRILDRFIEIIHDLPESESSLYIDNAGMNDEDVPSLVAALNAKPSITILSLDYNNIGDKGAEELAKLKYVSYLILDRNNIASGVYNLASNETFEMIRLKSNNISEDDLIPLLKIQRKKQVTLALGQNVLKGIASKNPNIKFDYTWGCF